MRAEVDYLIAQQTSIVTQADAKSLWFRSAELETSKLTVASPALHHPKKFDRTAAIKGVLRLEIHVALVVVIAGGAGTLKILGLARHTNNGFHPRFFRLFTRLDPSGTSSFHLAKNIGGLNTVLI